jgi:hypothetical protein
MKIFNLYKSIGVLALAITLLTSCSKDQYWNDNPLNDPTAPSTLPALTSGSADFSNYVALGASFSAGESSGSVFIKAQEYSFPNLLAEAFSNTVTLTDTGTEGFFSQPMVNDNIGGLLLNGEVFQYEDQSGEVKYRPRLYFNGQAPAYLDATPTTEISNILTGPFNNMGVSGIKSYQFTKQGYGDISGLGSGANPYFVRMASSPSATVLGDAVSQDPTFFTISVMGGNDVLSYATSGGAYGIDQIGNQETSTYSPYDITDPTAFNTKITEIVSALTANGAKGVLSNVPYVTDLPFFTAVPYAALDPTNPDFGPQIPVLNASFNRLNQAFAFLGFPERSIVFAEAAASPVVIFDKSLPSLTDELFFVLELSGVDSFTAALLAQQYGQSRQATAEDLLLLPSSGVIGKFNEEHFAYLLDLGVPAETAGQLSVNGITYPLADNFVLTDIEIQKTKDATDAYTMKIISLADSYGLAFVNLKDVLSEASSSGLVFDNFNMTTDLVFGGLVSLSGIHLTARGYALMANEFLEQIDATYGSNFGASGSMLQAADYVIMYPENLPN